ncbi:hypothetical protein AZE42_01817 [Rhizopogon vesiculosus]|uniref:F-box domain-containing protein n=1 Tax=Rhizopogon vesiculosus TaxID=180088 RepID=A0A1J8QEJ6_9AGAM|nr:hypothetical protein AZE42_01817 [Rhizopogon vesiculosus]
MSSVVDSTCIPSVAEIKEAQLALQRDGQELEHVESMISGQYAEIEAIHKRICPLEENRRAVQSRIFTNRARISPMRFLPTQILQRIFKACIPDDRYVTPDIQSAPLLLCQICRRWREVAEASSELWSSIAVDDLNDKGSYTAMVTRWLVASHHRPLARLFSAWCSHTQHFMTFHLFLDVAGPATHSPLPTYPPNLTHLGIREFFIHLINILVDFPALVQLKIVVSLRCLFLPSFDTVPIEHRALEILCIYLKDETIMSASSAKSLARTFDFLPSLRELTFFGHCGASLDLWLPESVHALLFDRSSCLLKRLLFHNFKRPLDMDALRERFRSFGIELRADDDSSDSFW